MEPPAPEVIVVQPPPQATERVQRVTRLIMAAKAMGSKFYYESFAEEEHLKACFYCRKSACLYERLTGSKHYKVAICDDCLENDVMKRYRNRLAKAQKRRG